MKHVYVVATSQKEADALAEEHGHESREDAQFHLIDVKRPVRNLRVEGEQLKRIVINADDYNLTSGCDRAIEEAMRAGAVTSASCLVWDRRPELPEVMQGRTGLHLRLTDGAPVIDAGVVSSLVGGDGSFPRSRAAVQSLNVDRDEVMAEWCAQGRLFGHTPTHLDTHRHTHSIPGINEAYEFRCYESYCAGVPLDSRQRDRLRVLGVRCADYAEIRWLDGRLDTLQRLLLDDFQRYETVHLMTHPGFVDDELRRKSGMVEVRRREFDALMDIGFASWLDSEGIEKIGMAQLSAPADPLAQVDIIFLAWNRPEYTAESLRALAENTDWDLVRRLIVYTDGEPMRNGYVAPRPIPDRVLEYDMERHGGPVAIMNHYLRNRDPLPWFAKIDNDVIVPPGWLPECLATLRTWPNVDLLGIEAVNWTKDAPFPDRRIEPCGHIGGIGLMRTAAFDELPVAAGRMGFSDWQIHHDVTKAWLNPSLPVILLDRLPFEPWASLGKEYEAKNWQRPWRRYTEADSAIWDWWRK